MSDFSTLLILTFLPIFIVGLFLSAVQIRAKRASEIELRKIDRLPPVSIIICALNEDQNIKKKLDFLFSDSEWIEGSEVIVVCAGSEDGTPEILNSYETNKTLKTIVIEEKLSKVQCINKAVLKSKNNVLVFSDCRQEIVHGSVAQIVKNFQFNDVGLVSSVLVDDVLSSKSSVIRAIINWCSISMSKTGSAVTVYGGLYAMRKAIFTPIPEEIMMDDLYNTINTLSQGSRVIMEPKAIISDYHLLKYFKKERINRSTRGLLNFMHKQNGLLKRLSWKDRINFLVVKYLRIFTVFWVPVFLFYAVMNMRGFEEWIVIWGAVVLTIPYFIFKKEYEFIGLVAFTTMVTVFDYLFNKKRSVHWEELEIDDLE